METERFLKDTIVYLVDDDPHILELLKYNLETVGAQVVTFEHAVDCVLTLKEGKEEEPDLLLLDVMMPQMDGFEACRLIRDLPLMKPLIIAFLTAKNDDFFQLHGFESGGDDYIFKPIKPKVLLRRIRALLRHRWGATDQKTEFADLKLLHEQHELLLHGNSISVSKKEFQLLSVLMSDPDKVFTRVELFQLVWNENPSEGNRTLDVHIRKLRKKLGDHYIKTVKGVGYGMDS